MNEKTQLIIPAKKLGLPLMPDYCPRCHYVVLHMRGPFPFAPFPQIFSSIDSYTKGVFEVMFTKGVVPSALECFGTLNEFIPPPTHHTFALEMADGVVIRGSPDAIFRRDDDRLIIADYKCARAKGMDDALFPIYQVQISAYKYILEHLEDESVEKLGLIYTEPSTHLTAEEIETCITENGFDLRFEIKVHETPALENKEIESLAATAREVYDQLLCPKRRAGCKTCDQLDQMLDLVLPQMSVRSDAVFRSSAEYEMAMAASRIGDYARVFR